MKKITLLVASLLLVGSMAKASENPVFSDNGRTFGYDYRDAEPISFMERGIEFYVFANGEFDFNTRPTQGGYTTVVYRGKRGATQTTYYGSAERGVKIEHDYNGRVRRVGNVFINYDARGRVSKIGSVYMRYNSFALAQVGGLRIIYNRRGQIIDYVGFVNRYSNAYVYHPQENHNHGYGGYGNAGYNNEYQGGSDNYYYRTDGTKAEMTAEDVVEIERYEREKR